MELTPIATTPARSQWPGTNPVSLLMRPLHALMKSVVGHETVSSGYVDDPTTRGEATAVFPSPRTGSRHYVPAGLEALPRGEPVEVRLNGDGELPIMLARYPYRLCGGRTFSLVDHQGRRFPLRAGKNYVGRQAGNDVVVAATQRSVSRRHLIVEPVGRRIAVLTDVSSHGTFVPPQCVV